MHAFLPGPENNSPISNDPIFMLEGEVRSSTINTANDISLIEGYSLSNIFAKVLSIYDAIDQDTRKIGARVYSSPDLNIKNFKRILTPKNFLRTLHTLDEGTGQQVRFNVDLQTKNTIEHHIQRDSVDYDSLMTGAFAYYGMLATYLYAGEELYINNIFKPDLQRFEILG